MTSLSTGARSSGRTTYIEDGIAHVDMMLAA